MECHHWYATLKTKSRYDIGGKQVEKIVIVKLDINLIWDPWIRSLRINGWRVYQHMMC